MMSATMLFTTLKNMQDTAVTMIELNEKNEKEETDLRVVRNSKPLGVSDAVVSPQHRQETKCSILHKGKHAVPNSRVSQRTSMSGRRAASCVAFSSRNKRRHAFPRQVSLRGWRESDSRHDSTLGGIPEERSDENEETEGIFQNNKFAHVVSDAEVSSQQRHVRARIVSPLKEAAPNNYVPPKRAGRRGSWTGSSTTFGPGSKGRHGIPRQISLRRHDSGYDGALVEISEVKRTRLHDYTESPNNVL